jgi:hypothetical protein
MKTIFPCFFVAVALFPLNAHGQGRSNDFQITKINKNLITNPQYTYNGAEQYQANQRDRWLEVEVEFTAAPDFTDELTFKYFILINGKVLTGEALRYVCPPSGAGKFPGQSSGHTDFRAEHCRANCAARCRQR